MSLPYKIASEIVRLIGVKKMFLKNKDQRLEYAKVENANAVFEGMCHGQFFHGHPQEYAKKLKIFLENK